MRISLALPAAVLALSLLAGCSGDADSAMGSPFTQPQYAWGKGEPETLSVWGVYPDLDRIYIQRAFERYQELTDNRLELVQIPQDEFEERVVSAFAGEGEQPDVLLSYGGTNIEPFDPDAHFYDFSDAPWVEDLTDTSVNQTVYNGKIVGLPHWEASVSGTLYNKKIFHKYQLDIPGTQEEFLSVCEKLLRHGVTPLYLPGKEISMLLYQLPLDAVVQDDNVLQGLNDVSISYADLPEMETIVSWYRTMAQRGYLGDTYAADDWAGMSDAMSSGEYAMMLCWDTWLYTDFEGNAENFGLMPAFIGLPENGTFEGPNLGLFIVNRGSPKLDAALDLITFMSDPYNYNAAFEGIYTAPVFKNQVASISTPQYLEAERLIERNFHDSTAWLRIRGFSQMDASSILAYMDPASGQTANECLRAMDELRAGRMERG